MAIQFKRISYKNFKAVGSAPIVIDFEKTSSTLITGKNGAGKSTLTSAICFALFGQDFVLNKPGLINTINLKNLEVILDFVVGTKNYRIIRGIKPNVFKIYEDEILLNEDAASRDYQKVLETQILKMDIRAFRQVVVVGGRSYTPFMKLKANERREFIEDLLDIRIFSTMGVLLKDRLKSLKEEMRCIDEELKTIIEKVRLQKAFIEKLSVEKTVSIGKIETGIQHLRADNHVLAVNIKSETGILEKQLEAAKQYENLAADYAKLQHEWDALRSKKRAHMAKVKFYEETTNCPTCTQNIAHEHRELILHENNTQIDDCSAMITEVEEKMTAMTEKLNAQSRLQKEIAATQGLINEWSVKSRTNMTMIERAVKEIETLKNDSTSIDDEKAKAMEFAKRYIALNDKKKELMESEQYHEYVKAILADGGIKSKIIKQYIPTINTIVNKYLSAMDFFVSFHLDENFDETIKSRHRDTFKYDNFSDGQAARIDLALMFAWRDIAKMRNAVNTNLLILDEIDKEVDGDGASLISELLQRIEKSSVFVISHKGDQLRDKFDRALTFELINNFTVMKEE